MGNIMFHDEGLGTYLVKYLEANYHTPANLTLVDGGVLGFKLMTYYQEYDRVVIVTTSSQKGEAGTISRCDAEEMMSMGDIRQTANEVELTMMLEICSFHEDMGEVEILSMIPEDIIDVRVGLSDTILAKMPDLLDTTLKTLEEQGIVLQPKASKVSFAQIIESCANPMTERMTLG